MANAMKSKSGRIALSLAIAISVLLAVVLWSQSGYSYHVNANWTNYQTPSSSQWDISGSWQGGADGLMSSGSGPAAAIWKTDVDPYAGFAMHPDGETVVTMAEPYYGAPTSDSSVIYLRATPDALLGPSSAGTFYALEFSRTRNPSNWFNPCSATLTLKKRVSGVITDLTQVADVGCNLTMRVVIRGNHIVARHYYGSGVIFDVTDGSIATGRMGIGAYGTSGGNYMVETKLGGIEPTAPPGPGNIGYSATTQSVTVTWAPSGDNPGGVGLWRHKVYRNGALIGTVGEFDSQFIDSAVTPGALYTYEVEAEDQHFNLSARPSVQVIVPGGPSQSPPRSFEAPRQTGVRALGTYWGSAGENIDMVSGNLNFTEPVVTAVGRGATSVPFVLNYNSQNWLKDGSTVVKYGVDVGYGFGWRLMAGSIVPVWSGGNITHYVFTDSSGAEYKLDQLANSLWTSRDGDYVTYEAPTNRIWFNNGTQWVMGSVSSAGEPDAGTRYPTEIKDSNGNVVSIRYQAGSGSGAANTSARIVEVEDVRAVNTCGSPNWTTYRFTYNTDSTPHLTNIENCLTTGVSPDLSFAYSAAATLKSPFSPYTSYGTTKTLSSVTTGGIGTQYLFYYGSNSAGELTRVVYPYKGELRWDYREFTYLGRTIREVQYRRLMKQAGAALSTYTLVHDDAGDVNRKFRWYTRVDDAGGAAQRYYEAILSGTYEGLSKGTLDVQLPGYLYPQQQTIDWTADANGRPYVWSTTSRIDYNQPSEKTSWVHRTVDAYGNLIQQAEFEYGNPSTPVRVKNWTYLNSTQYTSRYIRNRMTSGPGVSVVYDEYGLANPLVNRTGLREHDSATYNANYTYRGNATTTNQASVGTPVKTQYDITGMASGGQFGGTTTSTTPTSNNAVPGNSTVNGNSNWATTMSWNQHLGLTSASGPNGVTVSMNYDPSARPSWQTGANGELTTFTYNDTASPPTRTTSTDGRFVKETFDGFGRVIKAEEGHGSTVVSTVETEYQPCACSPVGKMSRQTLPYAPGGTKYWTNYSYDALGRTLAVTPPAVNGAGATTYAYSGNQVTVTDAAGKWKKMETNALGQLVKVIEPNPAGGQWESTYSYDFWDQVTGVTMTRGGTTQTRTFVYSNHLLTSSTNPENGTVTYTYGAQGRMESKTDAKGQKIWNIYDYGTGRLTETQRWINASTEDTAQKVKYYYDINPFDAGYTQYAQGRVAAVELWTMGGSRKFTEMYSYTQSGLVTKKRLRVEAPGPTGVWKSADLDSEYTFDHGRMTSMKYPNGWEMSGGPAWTGETFNYTFDAMLRPNGMTQQGGSTWVSGIVYDHASRLKQMTYGGATETRNYNTLGQLTTISGLGTTLTYNYPTSGNTGRISSMVHNGETVTYAYDALNRLISATSSQFGAETFGFDGFGNLTQKGGQTIGVDPGTNRMTGPGISYDANGNQMGAGYAFDVDNRLVGLMDGSNWPIQYGYGPDNRRVWSRKQWQTSPDLYTEEVTYYGATGQRMGVYEVTWVQLGGPTSPWELRLAMKRQEYYYDAQGRMASKTDAEGQKIWNIYDYGTGRLTETQQWISASTEDTAQKVKYYYDNNPFDAGYTQYAQGRVAAVEFWTMGGSRKFTEMYSYTQSGLATKKRLRVEAPGPTGVWKSADLDSEYTFDHGRMTSMKYPNGWEMSGSTNYSTTPFREATAA